MLSGRVRNWQGWMGQSFECINKTLALSCCCLLSPHSEPHTDPLCNNTDMLLSQSRSKLNSTESQSEEGGEYYC